MRFSTRLSPLLSSHLFPVTRLLEELRLYKPVGGSYPCAHLAQASITYNMHVLTLSSALLSLKTLTLCVQVARGVGPVQASCVGVQPAQHHKHGDEQTQAQQAGHAELRQWLGRPAVRLWGVAAPVPSALCCQLAQLLYLARVVDDLNPVCVLCMLASVNAQVAPLIQLPK